MALKSLVVIHSLLSDGDPLLHEEIMDLRKSGIGSGHSKSVVLMAVLVFTDGSRDHLQSPLPRGCDQDHTVLIERRLWKLLGYEKVEVMWGYELWCGCDGRETRVKGSGSPKGNEAAKDFWQNRPLAGANGQVLGM